MLWVKCGTRCRNFSVGSEEQGGQPKLIGAEEAGVGGGEALHDFGARMAEGVLAADRDDGIVRSGEGEEFGRARGAAAVMADL